MSNEDGCIDEVLSKPVSLIDLRHAIVRAIGKVDA